MMNKFYDNTGERIRELRELSRYTREEFAEMVEISPKFLYEIETGKKGFSADTLYRIANAFSVSCEYILSGNEVGLSQKITDVLSLFNGAQLDSVIKLLHILYEINTKSE